MTFSRPRSQESWSEDEFCRSSLTRRELRRRRRERKRSYSRRVSQRSFHSQQVNGPAALCRASQYILPNSHSSRSHANKQLQPLIKSNMEGCLQSTVFANSHDKWDAVARRIHSTVQCEGHHTRPLIGSVSRLCCARMRLSDAAACRSDLGGC